MVQLWVWKTTFDESRTNCCLSYSSELAVFNQLANFLQLIALKFNPIHHKKAMIRMHKPAAVPTMAALGIRATFLPNLSDNMAAGWAPRNWINALAAKQLPSNVPDIPN